jgi:peptidoglycan/xylan/chitin deacetylase (PgdA/CDA1 family)
LKELLRRGLARLVVGSGVAALGRRAFPKGGTMILFGHRVQDDDEGFLQGIKPQWFAQQMEYLTRNYEIIPLSRLLQCYEEGKDPPTNSVVLTFDDGFQDNLVYAFPVLDKMKIPATVFLVTGSLKTGALPWSQRLGYLFQNTKSEVFFDELMTGVELRVCSRRDRYRSYLAVKKRVGVLPLGKRQEALKRISENLGVEPPRNRMLTWDQARTMQATGLVEFGAHTVSHPWMTHVSRDEATRELEQSRNDLKEHLDVNRPSFAFPGGSFNDGLVEMVKNLGFRSVFQSRHGLRVNHPGRNDQFSLSRVGLPNAEAFILEAELDGPFHPIRRVYRRGR